MRAFLNKTVVRVALALTLALFGPFLLPPHVVGVYIPLGSLLFRSAVWRGEPDSIFYSVFFVEWVFYACLIYGVCKLAFKFIRGDT